MTRRSILFVTWDYHPVPAGGAEHQARLQAEELARRGHEVTVICPSSHARSGRQAGVWVRRLPGLDRRPFRTVTFMVALVPYLLWRLRRLDVVHIHLAGLYADLIVFLARLFRVPVYIKIAAGGASGEVRRLRGLARITRYYALRHAAAVQALSREIGRELLAAGVAPERIVALPNGVDTIRFAPAADADRVAARRALDLPNGVPVAVYLGRFSEYKGVADLAAAWQAALPLEGLLVMVGRRSDRPPEEEVSVASARQLDVRDWTTDADAYFRAADIFVLPSRSEGMSNVLLEAMSTGTPVIATRVGAAEDVIADGESGWLVDPGDVTGLTEALRGLINEPERRTRLAAGAVTTVRARYSVAVVVDQILTVYDQIISGAAPSLPAPRDESDR